MADLSRREFHQLLGDQQIERHYTSDDLEANRATLHE
ncbi:UPF0175 family protein [Natrinema sp. S1CR25-10]|uniref:UPF0175 family protein n=1 Tax=Natrinema salsiterrestre TaxID=2950540 RepID=A0A9Q4L3K1_9EURY|nr:UPF0175 family protein [Natrinema salsiterrestre]